MCILKNLLLQNITIEGALLHGFLEYTEKL